MQFRRKSSHPPLSLSLDVGEGGMAKFRRGFWVHFWPSSSSSSSFSSSFFSYLLSPSPPHGAALERGKVFQHWKWIISHYCIRFDMKSIWFALNCLREKKHGNTNKRLLLQTKVSYTQMQQRKIIFFCISNLFYPFSAKSEPRPFKRVGGSRAANEKPSEERRWREGGFFFGERDKNSTAFSVFNMH